ncbi:Inositol oxygenase 1 [Cocos nucifera]|nr:Inositol oxygenase 1 [Cocos nucifera]
MTISIEQPEIEVEVEDKEVPRELVLDGGFMVPGTNSFGHTFRDYDVESERKKTVEEFYRKNHVHQTYDFVKRMRGAYGKLDRLEMSIWECVELLNEFIDDSDPDLDEPQIEHLLQTAEAIRKEYPDEDWLHLTGLIHDLGKVLLHQNFGQLPQWAVVGDTFPVGCAFDDCNVHHKVAKENKTTLPSAALFIIRYHSFYPLHKHGAYQYLMNDEDRENLRWLHIFKCEQSTDNSFFPTVCSKYDLYSKSKVRIDVEKVKPYYLSLIEKYFPAKLRW